jgi:serine/threonine-protein kinase
MKATGDFLCRNVRTFVGIALASALLTAVVGAVAFSVVILPDKRGVITVTVPDLIGTYYEKNDDESIYSVSVRYEYNEDVPAGVVVKQYPTAGLERKVIPGERTYELTLVVSRGRNTVMLPNLMGKTEQYAVDELHRLGLECDVEYDMSSELPRGCVCATVPSAYSDVPTGGAVTLIISGEASKSFVMPALTGLNETEAIARLTRLGVAVGKSDYVTSDEPLGIVVAQSIPFGSNVTTDATVYLTVSKGNR